MQPPSPEIPVPIAGLTAVERGQDIQISFVLPQQTTDNLLIREFDEITLQLGPDPKPFEFARWVSSGRLYEITPPPKAPRDDPKAIAIQKTIPAAEWAGRQIAVGARTSVKSDRYSSWSNIVHMQVVTPLEPPTLTADDTAKGIRVRWKAQADDIEYKILRQGPTDSAPQPLGIAKGADYLDTTSQFDTHYIYSAIAIKLGAESLPSAPFSFLAEDRFAPSIPEGLSPLAAPNSVELTWMPSPEPDTKGYFIYRAPEGGAFARIGDLVRVPSYSDHQVEHGKLYRYAVTAIDQKGHESDRSTPVEAPY